MITFSKFLKGLQLSRVVVLMFLLLLFVVAGAPGYLTGKWPWQQSPPIINLKEVKNIRNVGLSLPGWHNLKQSQENIGEHKWSYQEIQKDFSSTQAILLLCPQTEPKDKPETEWADVMSWGILRWGKWDVAQYRIAEFSVKAVKVNTSFFRAFTEEKTFAVLQWYAVSNGGNPSPLSWFYADQLAQWHKTSVPWVAVSILIPIEPLGDVEKSWSLVRSLGETVQDSLMASGL